MKTSISNNIYRKHVIAVLIMHIGDFAVFAGLYHFPLLKPVPVSSILDYCNSVLYNTANKDIAKLHRVQNCLASLVTCSP